MIISVAKAKSLISFPDTWTDDKIKMKLKAVEQTIRAYTNNNFQDRDCRRTADIVGGLFLVEALTPFDVGDTVQISESGLNKGLFTVASADDSTFTVEEPVKDENDVLVTKIVYPDDVIACCVNLMEWEVNNRGKVGIKSETLSRHSVTYFDQDASNQMMGYPAALLGCLKPYRKARC
jgi:hypothetical protein